MTIGFWFFNIFVMIMMSRIEMSRLVYQNKSVGNSNSSNPSQVSTDTNLSKLHYHLQFRLVKLSIAQWL